MIEDTAVSISGNEDESEIRMSSQTAGGWPDRALALRKELEATPGRLALLVDGLRAEEAARRLADAWGTTPVQVGHVLTTSEQPPTPEQVIRELSDGAVFIDLEILFWKDLRLDPVSLIRQLARSGPRVFLWPGHIVAKTASFSHPGRADHYEARLSDAIVLRAKAPRFPDEAPYEIERIP